MAANIKTSACTKSNLLLIFLLLNELFQTYASDAQERTARELERPYLVRNLELFGIHFPFTPITVIIFLVSILILYRGFTKQSTATASHILLDAPDGKEKMLKFKKEIGNDPDKFAQYAKKYSSCPSGKGGGSLGKFKLGSMVPSFDSAVFNPKNKVGVVLEPVQSQFGWHLILIKDRDEQRQFIV